MQRMKTRFLSEGDYNVIIVDWSCGNEFPYFQAIQNSKIVADELKKLINFLRDSRGAEPGDFHLIGHSLGSHIAGLVGHGVPHLGRISEGRRTGSALSGRAMLSECGFARENRSNKKREVGSIETDSPVSLCFLMDVAVM
ncbi:pancreatic lipase-related protein 1 [Trichonephila inaurata madagascariensis]|uniref:Pancreatic lipase-related protein 1 n=1 Tax=Trichonephila inaurata madagascariensis TaxID=2747483 RepID=A0A8X6XRH0_9ARAC|nr:pancreatic lipase-related protein 1 [Trichonephila inaurata madagascariensis]